MVYADSPHIHLLQSVANQSKVRDNKNREYSKSKQQLLFACAYRSTITIQVSWWLYQAVDFKSLIIPTQPNVQSHKHQDLSRKTKYSSIIAKRTLFFFLSIQPTNKEPREPGHTQGSFIQICTASKSNTSTNITSNMPFTGVIDAV